MARRHSSRNRRPQPLQTHPDSKYARHPIYGHKCDHAKEHAAWAGMISRCTSPRSPAWNDYGGRGIQVYSEWMASFWVFFEDVGPRPDGDYSLDRSDVDGHYEPGNVRWARVREQVANRGKFLTELYFVEGVYRTLAEIEGRYGIDRELFRLGIMQGMTVDQAAKQGRAGSAAATPAIRVDPEIQYGYINFEGKRIYLGPHGSPEMRQNYIAALRYLLLSHPSGILREPTPAEIAAIEAEQKVIEAEQKALKDDERKRKEHKKRRRIPMIAHMGRTCGRRSKDELPAYRRHKASNRAYVHIDNKQIYLGKYGSRESHERYREEVKKFLIKQGRIAVFPELENFD